MKGTGGRGRAVVGAEGDVADGEAEGDGEAVARPHDELVAQRVEGLDAKGGRNGRDLSNEQISAYVPSQ